MSFDAADVVTVIAAVGVAAATIGAAALALDAGIKGWKRMRSAM
ncbi:major capsid protein [Neptunomonas sp. XY-337]|nr:major capsid protein [Neptunomonas sp. XY-337]